MTTEQFSPKILESIYSFDRVRFISGKTVKELRAIIPEQKLLYHCIPDKTSIVNAHIDPTGRAWGYKTKVEASACTDSFMQIINGYEVGQLSHLQIARDIIFSTMEEANSFMEWFEKNVSRRYSRKSFKWETTLYLGKYKGERAENYIRCYPRESKMNGMPCFHSEFVLEGSTAIKRALKIKSFNDLPTCMECYYALENKYIDIKDSHLNQGIKFGSQYIQNQDYKRIKERLTQVKNK
jgi:disulfide oxidoreductase YuzD